MSQFIVRAPITGKDKAIYLPAKETDLQEYCDALGIANDMRSTIEITEILYDQRLRNLLVRKECNISELNLFATQYDTLDKYAQDIFFAVTEAKSHETLLDHINFCYNTHRYGLVADFSDLNALGKKVYLNESGGSTAEELAQFDGEAYLKGIMAKTSPLITTYGLIYPNGNEEMQMYDGRHFPILPTSKPITVCISTNIDREYLYLPCEQSEVNKALERLRVDTLSDVGMEIERMDLPENISAIAMQNGDNLERLNNVARVLHDIGQHEHEHLSRLVDFTKVDNIADLETLAKAMYEFEIIPKVHNDYEYGYHMITRSGRFEYDENLKGYIDFERYGRERNSMNGSVYTEHGYLNYLGYNPDMCGILNKNLGMSLEIEPYLQTIRLYMPLEVTTYYEEDYYGHYRQTDYEGTLDSKELCGYEDELNEFLTDYQPEMETERGLMEYYGKADTVNAKVKSYHFEFEELSGNVYGVVVAKLNAPLDAHELESFRSLCEGQASDGVGEGLEQREFHLAGRDVYIHLWQSDKGWYMKTAEEMGFEQAQGFEMKMM